MDRHRFNKRARELIARAQHLEDLSRLPDRLTEKDFHQAVALMRGAANDLEELVSATPIGCVCRRVRDNDYDYLDYAEGCVHHRQLYMLRESLKADYVKLEKTLKNETRMRIVLATLTGAALNNTSADKVLHDVKIAGCVANALDLADEVLKQITETA